MPPKKRGFRWYDALLPRSMSQKLSRNRRLRAQRCVRAVHGCAVCIKRAQRTGRSAARHQLQRDDKHDASAVADRRGGVGQLRVGAA
eukprot:2641607-Prymnesium_polylepis.1